MKKNKKLWLGMVSIVLALLLFSVLLVIQHSMNREPVYEKVLCAKQMIPAQIVMTPQNIEQYVEEKRIPVEWLPEGYFTERKQLQEMVFVNQVSQGSILTSAMCAAHHTYYDRYSELTWISIPIKELYEGVAGTLRSGDYIDIYTLWEEEKQVYCEPLAEHIRVEATYNVQGAAVDEQNREGLSQLIVVPMEQEQVATFYEKLARGNIRIAKYEG